jgi:hypothetical protein
MLRFKIHTAIGGLVAGVLLLGPTVGIAVADQSGQPGQGPAAPRASFPPVPAAIGCYRLSAGVWQDRPCLSGDYVRQHIPHPELLAGIAAGALVGAGPGAAPTYVPTGPGIESGVVEADPVYSGGYPVGGQGSPTGEIDSDLSAPGLLAYSIQSNTSFFSGTNGLLDAVQFSDQTRELDNGAATNDACVWQVKAPFGSDPSNYTAACAQLNDSNPRGWADMVIGSALTIQLPGLGFPVSALETVVQAPDGNGARRAPEPTAGTDLGRRETRPSSPTPRQRPETAGPARGPGVTSPGPGTAVALLSG